MIMILKVNRKQNMSTICLNEVRDELINKIEDHDCHFSPEDSCECSKWRVELNEVVDEMAEMKWEHLEADIDEE